MTTPLEALAQALASAHDATGATFGSRLDAARAAREAVAALADHVADHAASHLAALNARDALDALDLALDCADTDAALAALARLNDLVCERIVNGAAYLRPDYAAALEAALAAICVAREYPTTEEAGR